jgi:pseudaminic acid cytidylyltransferase
MLVALIPARGGSKRIPRKNIRMFAGKPMMVHSIECARRSGLFDRVIVSTDDEEIATVAREFGAEVPFMRPGSLADDYTGTTEVVAHAVRSLSPAASHVCCIYPTAPFIQTEDLREGWCLMRSGQWRFVFAATRFVAPVQRSFRQAADGGIEMLFPEHFSSRSQDLPPVLHDAAQFYWGHADAWMSLARMYDRHSTVVAIPHWRVQDIDTEEDWQRAEAMAARLGSGARLTCDTASG